MIPEPSNFQASVKHVALVTAGKGEWREMGPDEVPGPGDKFAMWPGGFRLLLAISPGVTLGYLRRTCETLTAWTLRPLPVAQPSTTPVAPFDVAELSAKLSRLATCGELSPGFRTTLDTASRALDKMQELLTEAFNLASVKDLSLVEKVSREVKL